MVCDTPSDLTFVLRIVAAAKSFLMERTAVIFPEEDFFVLCVPKI
jgi:hypothetical protein